ncbi:MAG: mechanosensitive ion channel family protein [Bauldia sp.]|nr:mechanosensitive ion channel family protein [Bauldia sp.]
MGRHAAAMISVTPVFEKTAHARALALRALSGVLLLLLVLLPGALHAQSDAENQEMIDGWRATLSQTEAALGRTGLTTRDLDEQRDKVQEVLAAARAFNAILDPQVADLEAQLKAIAPADDQTALPPSIQKIHDELATEYETLRGLAGQTSVIILSATKLIATISERRSAVFSARLFERGPSVLDPGLWSDTINGFPQVLAGAGRVLSAWIARIAASTNQQVLLLLVAAAIAVLFVLAVRFLFVRWARAWTKTEKPTPARRVLMATGVVIADIGVPMAILFGLRALFAALGLLPPGIGLIFDGLTVAVAIFSVITGMARALAAPGRSEWRIGGIADDTARRAYRIVAVAAFLIALPPLADHLARVAAMPSSWAIGFGGILSVPTALLALLATRVLVLGRERMSAEEYARGLRWRILTPIAAIAAIATIVAASLGFLAFARFTIEQIAWVWVVSGIYVVLAGLADLLIGALLLPGHAGGLEVGRTVGLSGRTAERLAVLVSGVARIVIFLLAAIVVLAPWGFDSSTFVERVSGLYYGIEVGSFRFTFSSVFFALVIFAAVIVVSRIFTRWLDQRFLPTTSIDPGLKNSINTAAGYVGFILAALLALGYAGIDLANIALVAGALSVGIGFGLQSIVNNFVSGLILLAERPIRAGDWIQVGSDEGTVKRISVRATEIETFDRASVIIPNSSLISGVVKNWYLRDNSGRTMVSVGVGYGSDPEKVRDILLDIADKNEKVLKFPKPFVIFQDFGDSALVFQLYVYLASIANGLTVRSEVRFEILRRLREAGIEIPFPQRDINLRDWPQIENALREARAGGAGEDTSG